MEMLRRNRVKFGVIAMVAVLTVGIAGAIAVARGFGGYSEASSVAGLQSARGVVYDWAQTDGPVAGNIRDWMISGEWTLNCHKACAKARLHQIEFDMALAMFLDPTAPAPGAKGDNSHGHQFSNFSATSATVAGSVLTILGTIDGSGPLGGDIIITLRRHAPTNPQHFTFSFDLTSPPPGNIITTVVSGVVVESNGSHDDDDDDDDD